jgi:DNA-binding transcriptional LysR family regulator
MHLAQPSATKVIRELERLFGFALFERRPRGMRPTEGGVEVLEFAQRALGDLQRFMERLEHRRQGRSGQLVIGNIPGSAANHVARAIAELKKQRPFLSVKLLGESGEEVIGLLLTHDIELGIGCFVGLEQHSVIAFEPLGSEVPCVVTRVNHPATRLSELRLSSLKDYPWIVPPLSTPARQIFEQEFGEAGLKTPANIVECVSCLSALQLVQQSNAVAVIPESVVCDHVRAGLIARLPIIFSKQSPTFGVLSRRGEPLGAVANEFLAILRSHATVTDPREQMDPEKETERGSRVGHRPSAMRVVA